MNKMMCAAGLAGAMCLSGLAHGQVSGGGAVIEEVIVTAQKRTENLQDVPFTVQAIDDETLRRTGVSDLRDIASLTSNVKIHNDKNNIQITIRGISNNEDLPNSATAFHADGIYSGIPQTGMLAFLDVERVEVLKGPQGTVYGRNSTAGVVNVISKRPNLTELQGRVDVVAGDYGLLRTEGAINLPIVGEQFAVRFSGLYEDRDGYNEHDGLGVPSENSDNRDNKAFKARVLWAPTDRVSWLLGAEAGSQEGPGPRVPLDFKHLIPFEDQEQRLKEAGLATPATLGTLNFLAPQPYYGRLPKHIQDRIASDERFVPISPGTGAITPEELAPDSDLTSDAYLSELGIDFDAIEINFLAGYRQSDEDYVGTGSWWGLPNTVTNFFSKDEERSYELRVSGGERFYWKAGLYRYEQESEVNSTVTGVIDSYDEESLGVFGTGTLELADALRLTVGVRYSEDEIDGSREAYVTARRPTPSFFEQSVKFENWSGRFSVDWDMSAESMLYATISSGYKTGGVNFTSSRNPTYDEETVLSYEIGSKNILLDGALQLNASVFYNDYTDLQDLGSVPVLKLDENGALVTDPETGGRVVERFETVASNISDVDMYGAEVEWIWQATSDLRLDGSWAILETEINEGVIEDPTLASVLRSAPSPLFIDVSGNQMVRAPESSFRLGLEYTQRFSWGDLVPRIDFYWEDDTYHDLINRDQSIQEAWTRTDVGITYHSNDDKLLVQLWARNLEDDAIRSSIRQTSIGAISILMPPRTYGVRVGYQF